MNHDEICEVVLGVMQHGFPDGFTPAEAELRRAIHDGINQVKINCEAR